LTNGLSFFTFRRPQSYLRNSGDPGDITHAFKLNLVYDLPFGEGRRIGADGGVRDRIVGGWQIGASTIARSGRLIDLGNLRPDCIEVDSGARYGQCASQSLVVTGPMFRQTDLRVSKRTRVAGRTDFELAIEMLNAFNQPNFVPVGGVATNTAVGNNINNYEVT